MRELLRTRAVRGAAAVLVAGALTGTVTACGDATADDPAKNASSREQGSGSDSGDTGSAASGQTTGNAKGTQTGNGGRTPTCSGSDLAAGLGGGRAATPDMDTPDEVTRAAVWFKNTGSTTCALKGFPGIRISGPEGSDDLRRTARHARPVTLGPGERATAVFSLLTGDKDSGENLITPEKVATTPPGTTRTFDLKWPYGGAVQVQSTATTPAATVEPVGAG
ncbi:DUF4232 domain-containing protein [Streptomyces cacaoi]|uniref:DUF4232 domain-containing protein n=1 Tax=Streptomyces cacaoi TaxID=1898 RepID=A0A4Y3R2C9_STRCI|nr:DUF4232 domain-containing protein [Streptomyces cacaoi]NNG89702.1 DUF4232 domain-containing protein [Streptomyces cacaoi]GEB51886.1 hypothetical protein SCA03_44370 [Streptomyces cacaoi]